MKSEYLIFPALAIAFLLFVGSCEKKSHSDRLELKFEVKYGE